MTAPPAVAALADLLARLGWVTDLWVAGSVATGDHVPGVSDLDLVAVTDGPVDPVREEVLVGLHPTWTHGSLVRRILSGVTRAELARHGFAAFGRPPAEVMPHVTDDDVRRAARDELTGYWAWASRRPWMWLSPVIADLGLTSMARGRHALASGQLLTKPEAIGAADAPEWLRDQLRARRRGETVPSPRVPTGWIAWRDARRTVRAAGSWEVSAGAL